MMDAIDAAKIVLADSYRFTLLAQNYHWNVEGPFFSQLHELFGNIYEEVQGSIDKTAEEIRAMQSYTPASFKRFSELSSIEDETGQIDARIMLERLLRANEQVLASIIACFESANAENNQGLANWMAERQDAHKKHGWMLRSTLK
jgi:starvation-inducible DNA-binding protein